MDTIDSINLIDKTLSMAQAYLSNQDTILAEIIHSIPAPQINSTGDVFFDLVSCIMDQQIHYRSKGVYMKKLMDLLDGQMLNADIIQTLDPFEFTQKKIAANKYQALQNLATYWKKEKLDRVVDWSQLSEEWIHAQLLAIKGIGAWTVDMILLYTLNRPNIFHPHDLQLKKMMGNYSGTHR